MGCIIQIPQRTGKINHSGVSGIRSEAGDQSVHTHFYGEVAR